MNSQTFLSRYDRGYQQIHFNLKQTKNRLKLTQIFLSVTVLGERIRVYSKLRVEPEYWNYSENRCAVDALMSKRVQNRVRQINSQLDYIERQIDYVDHLCAENGQYLSKDMVRKVIDSVNCSRKRQIPEDALQIMRWIAENYQKDINGKGETGEDNTSRTYLMAINRLEKFIKSTKRQDLKFCDLSRGFIADFTDYLHKYTFTCGSTVKHYTSSTIAATLNIIKNILHKAYDMELCKNSYSNLFDNISMPHNVSDKIYLSESELAKLSRVKVMSETERRVRDLFVIASYTGLRISDINRLNEAAFSQNQITLIQTKTNNLVHIPILKEISDIIGIYRHSRFPQINTIKANLCIKELARRAGIDDMIIVTETRGGIRQHSSVPKYSQVCFHTARRSCITNLFKRGYSVNYIMSLSGHKSIASFQRYIKSSNEEMAEAFINELRKRNDVV